MADDKQSPVEAYNAQKKRREVQEAADRQQDAADGRWLEKEVLRLTGESGHADNLRVTVTVSGQPLTFTFFNTRRGSRKVPAVVWECLRCHQPVKQPIATPANVGELIVEGFSHGTCKP